LSKMEKEGLESSCPQHTFSSFLERSEQSGRPAVQTVKRCLLHRRLEPA
jgi:hypothetical protein